MRRGMGVLLSGCLIIWSMASDATERVTLRGALMPGSLVIGETSPGSRITLDGKPVRVAKDGTFLIGFGRDAKKNQTLEIHDPNGFVYVKDLKLEDRVYKITRIDGLPGRKVTPKPEDLKRINQDNAGIGRVRKLDSDIRGFSSGFQWPATGRISGIFGSQRILNGKPRNPHNGLDIAAPKGASVTAAANGTVALVHEDMFYSGKTVMIDHGHGLSSVYIHMSKITVTEGQNLAKGDKIGEVGMTGRTTGPHLHWGVSLFKTHLDPMLLVAGKTGVTEAK